MKKTKGIEKIHTLLPLTDSKITLQHTNLTTPSQEQHHGEAQSSTFAYKIAWEDYFAGKVGGFLQWQKRQRKWVEKKKQHRKKRRVNVKFLFCNSQTCQLYSVVVKRLFIYLLHFPFFPIFRSCALNSSHPFNSVNAFSCIKFVLQFLGMCFLFKPWNLE